MKKIGITFLMLLFVGVTATMAQDKKVAADSDAAAVKTEMKADKDASAEKHVCAPACKKSCCAGKTAAEKKACAPGCKKSCCMADGRKAEHDEHEGHNHDSPN